MKIVRKLSLPRERLLSFKKEKKKIRVVNDDELNNIYKQSKISSNLQILNNQTHELSKQEKILDNTNQLPVDYHHGNCICLFLMLVFYYLSIIITRFKNSLQENINKSKN